MTALVPHFILQQHAEGRRGGRIICASLFADISGFTALTETLSEHGREGAEALAIALRFYFDPLASAVHEAGGFITGFAGDAFTALFPTSDKRPTADYALWAASRMQSFFEGHSEHESPFGQFEFEDIEERIVDIGLVDRQFVVLAAAFPALHRRRGGDARRQVRRSRHRDHVGMTPQFVLDGLHVLTNRAIFDGHHDDVLAVVADLFALNKAQLLIDD